MSFSRLRHLSLLNVINKQKIILVLNTGYCNSYIKIKSWFCFPFSPDVSLDFISGNIRTLGKIKLTFSLGIWQSVQYRGHYIAPQHFLKEVAAVDKQLSQTVTQCLSVYFLFCGSLEGGHLCDHDSRPPDAIFHQLYNRRYFNRITSSGVTLARWAKVLSAMGSIHWIVFDTHGMECNFTATTLKCFWPWVMLLTQTVKANNLFPWYCWQICRITGAMWKHGQDVFFETLLKMLSHFGLLKFHCSRINSCEQSNCICHCKQTTVISSNLLLASFYSYLYEFVGARC